jgi:nitroreductase
VDIHELIRARRSGRAYQDKPVPGQVLERLLEAARWAPSAMNRQPWKLVVVTNADRRHRLAVAAREQMFVAKAPVVLAAVAMDPEKIFTCEVPGYPVDVAIVVDHLTLAATGEGLGTCWIAAFDQSAVCDILGVPADQKVVALLPLGYPADTPRQRTRKPLDELVAYETLS